MQNKETRLAALQAFNRADDAWSVELEKVFGKQAGGARYNSRLNGSTPELERLRMARNEAQNVYEVSLGRLQMRAQTQYLS